MSTASNSANLCDREFAQADVVAFLAAPATHRAQTVERISTHGAHVFLAGDRAYKLKRAVKLPFMDFSTLALRRGALEAELALNRKTAPHLYLDVRAIRRSTDGSLGFHEVGEVADWVLVMRRFDQADVLDEMAMRGALTPEIIDELADAIATMHRAAPPVQRAESECFRKAALDNIAVLREARIDPAAVTRLESELDIAIRACAQHLDRRAATGFVRRCHGDLHLRNIVCLDGRPTPFDALEFDPGLATGDVYYDLAFLLMDLHHRRLNGLAHRLFSRYLAATDDIDGLAALPLFQSVRAAVRAKVAALSAKAADAAAYVALANTYLPLSPPRWLAVGGFSGTGKSTVALELAPLISPLPGAVIVRSDIIRKKLFRVSEAERLPESAYTAEAHERVYAAMIDRAQRVASAGYSVIVDAVFARPDERVAIEKAAAARSVPFAGLWLQAPLSVRQARVGRRVNDPSDADAAVAATQETYDIGDVAWTRIDASKPAATVRTAVAAAVSSVRATSAC